MERGKEASLPYRLPVLINRRRGSMCRRARRREIEAALAERSDRLDVRFLRPREIEPLLERLIAHSL